MRFDLVAFDLYGTLLTIEKLEAALAGIVVADARKLLKPDARVYALLDQMAPRDRTLFVSSNGWDVDGCKRTGRTVAYVDRRGKPPAERPDLRLSSLEELAREANPP